jgi:hypothetical protein
MIFKIKFIPLLFILLIIFSLPACGQTDIESNKIKTIPSNKKKFEQFTRDSIISKLKYKIANSKPLVIHVFVPLCDNINQGIIPVGGKLGDGRNLKTNLYWGAGYGLKTWFTRSKEWKMALNNYNLDSSVLERAIYCRTYSNKAKVYLILDGYAGDKMEKCLTDYFKSLAGMLKDSIFLDSTKIAAYGKSDFLIFNGHNGLMDKDIPIYYNVDNIEKDAAVIACASHSYVEYRFECLKAYPLVTTTSLLPPEAYVISAVIDNWSTMQSDDKIYKSAGEAMAKVHKIAVKPCIKMFTTGW